jgi:hypothetical protein
LFSLFNTRAGKFGTKSTVTGFNAKIKAAWNKSRFYGLAPYSNLSTAILSVTQGSGEFFTGVHSIAPFADPTKSDFTQLAFASTAGLLQYALANDKHYKRIDDVLAVAEFPDRNPFTVLTGLTSVTAPGTNDPTMCPLITNTNQRRNNLAQLYPACEVYDTLYSTGSPASAYSSMKVVAARLLRDITIALPNTYSPDRFYELGSLTSLTCLASGVDVNGDYLSNAALDFANTACHCPNA